MLHPGTECTVDGLHVILDGCVTVNGHTCCRGECFGVSALLGQAALDGRSRGEPARLLKLTPERFADLSDRHPRLAMGLLSQFGHRVAARVVRP